MNDHPQVRTLAFRTRLQVDTVTIVGMLHVQYERVKDVCNRYPEQAGALWQAYIDLTLGEVNDLAKARSSGR